LSRGLANTLALMTLGVLYFEYRFDEDQLIRTLGHWLVYLQLIKFFLPKSAEDDWILFLLGLMQILISAVISQNDQIGLWLFGWAMLSIWVLGQFFLQREALRFLPSQGLAAASVAVKPTVDPYKGLFDLPYAVATTRVLVSTLALGGLIFLVLPRQAGAVRTRAGASMSRHLTGFDEEVHLGQFGDILENDSVVMTVEFLDESGRTVRPPVEPLWRGVTMLHYKDGLWRRQTRRSPQTIVGFPSAYLRAGRKTIRQRIKLEGNDSATLFGIRPFWDATASNRLPPQMSLIDATLYRQENRGGTYDYEVLSDQNPNLPQPSEMVPSFAQTEMLLAIPEPLKQRLRNLAEPVVASITEQGPEGMIARARALESYLRDSGKFTYSLHMEVIDQNLDPVEDFLVNRKEGHCEYFASALALLLRSIDIPSRVINGFKGGDWNELTQTMNVRQKHAHSWVEAYAGVGPGPGSSRLPIWIPLDPTPSMERERSVAQVGGVSGYFRPLSDVIRHAWVFYVVGYDGDRQNRLLYTPMRQMIGWLREKTIVLLAVVMNWFTVLFHFKDIGSFISLRGFLVIALVGTLAAVLVYLGFRFAHRLLRWLRGPVVDAASLTAGILFYRRLTQLLAEHELERTPAETQSEFAFRAGKFLSTRGTATQVLSEVPREVVDAFYRVRFGHLTLEPDSLQKLDARLDDLEASLKTPNR
jgi:transglutaminase-like putative cysteine protease